jgi:di/tricarboxylate transporter
MSVMTVVIRAASIPRQDAVTIGFAVFAASVPVSLIFLTGEATINPLAANYAGEAITFLCWLKVMGPPAALLSLLTMGLILVLFPPGGPTVAQTGAFRGKEATSNIPLSPKEIADSAYEC